MKKIAVVADSNSGYSPEEAEAAGIYFVPMPFYIDDKEYFESVNLTAGELFEFLENDAFITTSQPSPISMMTLWDSLLTEYEQILYLPMSSGLSGTCQTAEMLAQEYGGRVLVVDNQRISVPLKHSVQDALLMAEMGKSAESIKEYLERTKFDSVVYITVDTLKYLKKGGRITPAAAALGSLLKIKPVLQIRGEKLDSYAKARTRHQAEHLMIAALRSDIEELFDGNLEEVHLDVAYTGDPAPAEEMKRLLEAEFPGCSEITVEPLSLSITCHVGKGALGIACSRRLMG